MVGGMKALALTLGLAFMLVAAPAVAYADDGQDTDTQQADDPGIAHLHDAIADMRQARMALRDECADRTDAKCKADAKAAAEKAREAFKEAREKAIAEHHAFKEAAKAKREEAKTKRPTETPRSNETPRTPAPSASPRA